MKTMLGGVWKVGDDVDTDVILPSQYMNTNDPKILGIHCLEGYIQNNKDKINDGDILVAGKNFGCGSSREHAPIAIKSAGFSCVIAKSFARIFYRNAINIGLPILIVPDLPDAVKQGDLLEVDPFTGFIENRTSSKNFNGEALPTFIMEILDAGGAIDCLRKSCI